MPVYHYYCALGHETTRIRSMEHADDPCECAACGMPTEHSERRASPEAIKPEKTGNPLIVRDFKCDACGHIEEDEVLRWDEAESYRCVKCGGKTSIVPGSTTDLFSQNLYPYFDRGLGCLIKSKRHRDQICKERGLIPIDGDYDIGRDMGVNEVQRQRREEDALAEEYIQSLGQYRDLPQIMGSINNHIRTGENQTRWVKGR